MLGKTGTGISGTSSPMQLADQTIRSVPVAWPALESERVQPSGGASCLMTAPLSGALFQRTKDAEVISGFLPAKET
jgi:hypothetical protein